MLDCNPRDTILIDCEFFCQSVADLVLRKHELDFIFELKNMCYKPEQILQFLKHEKGRFLCKLKCYTLFKSRNIYISLHCVRLQRCNKYRTVGSQSITRVTKDALGPNKVLGSLGNVIFPPTCIASLWPLCIEEIKSFNNICWIKTRFLINLMVHSTGLSQLNFQVFPLDQLFYR